MENKQQYIPGVCNIGSQEINRRRRVGWIGLVAALLLFIILKLLPISPWWRLIIFFPAMFSATGFLQARFHFCVGFARKGVYNFGEVGKTNDINEDVSHSKDQQRAKKINLYAVIIGIIVTLIFIYI